MGTQLTTCAVTLLPPGRSLIMIGVPACSSSELRNPHPCALTTSSRQRSPNGLFRSRLITLTGISTRNRVLRRTVLGVTISILGCSAVLGSRLQGLSAPQLIVTDSTRDWIMTKVTDAAPSASLLIVGVHRNGSGCVGTAASAVRGSGTPLSCRLRTLWHCVALVRFPPESP